MFDFNDQVVMISGAANGLGADAAKGFAEQGANLVLLDIQEDRLLDLKTAIDKVNTVEVLTIYCDVTDEEQLKTAVQTAIEKFRKIDVLINNAGIAIGGDVQSLVSEEWDQIFNVNVKAIAQLSKYVVPHMIDKKYGRIINISSLNSIMMEKEPALWKHAYNATKSAVNGLTKGMAASYGSYGITVNAIGPGLFHTEMTKDTLFKSKEFVAMYNHMTPIGRPGNKGELNGPLMFFASKESSYMTGQILLADGGISLV